MWGPDPWLLREKLGVRGSLLIVWPCVRVGFMARMFQSFLPVFSVGLFFFFFLVTGCVGVTQIVFWFSFKGTCSLCSCSFHVSWEEGSSRVSCVTVFEDVLCALVCFLFCFFVDVLSWVKSLFLINSKFLSWMDIEFSLIFFCLYWMTIWLFLLFFAIFRIYFSPDIEI